MLNSGWNAVVYLVLLVGLHKVCALNVGAVNFFNVKIDEVLNQFVEEVTNHDIIVLRYRLDHDDAKLNALLRRQNKTYNCIKGETKGRRMKIKIIYSNEVIIVGYQTHDHNLLSVTFRPADDHGTKFTVLAADASGEKRQTMLMAQHKAISDIRSMHGQNHDILVIGSFTKNTRGQDDGSKLLFHTISNIQLRVLIYGPMTKYLMSLVEEKQFSFGGISVYGIEFTMDPRKRQNVDHLSHQGLTERYDLPPVRPATYRYKSTPAVCFTGHRQLTLLQKFNGPSPSTSTGASDIRGPRHYALTEGSTSKRFRTASPAPRNIQQRQSPEVRSAVSNPPVSEIQLQVPVLTDHPSMTSRAPMPHLTGYMPSGPQRHHTAITDRVVHDHRHVDQSAQPTSFYTSSGYSQPPSAPTGGLDRRPAAGQHISAGDMTSLHLSQWYPTGVLTNRDVSSYKYREAGHHETTPEVIVTELEAQEFWNYMEQNGLMENISTSLMVALPEQNLSSINQRDEGHSEIHFENIMTQDVYETPLEKNKMNPNDFLDLSPSQPDSTTRGVHPFNHQQTPAPPTPQMFGNVETVVPSQPINSSPRASPTFPHDPRFPHRNSPSPPRG